MSSSKYDKYFKNRSSEKLFNRALYITYSTNTPPTPEEKALAGLERILDELEDDFVD